MTQPDAALKRTPLHAAHVRLGARMIPFGGWDMPVQYSGIVEEHRAVRSAVGCFDVSHMGETGSYGPSVDKYIGIGYVPAALAAVGSAIAVEVRGRGQAARVVKTPFHPPRVKR